MEKKGKKLDFGSIYKEERFDYIHSHVEYFEKSVEKRNIIDIQSLLKEIQDNFFAQVKKDIEYFKALEDNLATTMIKKNKGKTFDEFPTKDRAGLLKYITTLKEITDREGDTAAVSLVKLKDNSIFIKEEFTKVTKGYEKLFEKKKIKLPQPIKTVGKLIIQDWDQIRTIVKNDPSFTKKEKEALKQLEKKVLENLKKSREELEKYLKILIEYVVKRYDLEGDVTDKTSQTAAREFLNTLKALGVDTTLAGEALEKEITQKIENMGTDKFFTTFLNEGNAKAFVGGLVEGYNTNSNFGIINEDAKIDALLEMEATVMSLSVPYLLESGDIISTGTISTVNTNSTMDVALAKKNRNTAGQISFGASLKLVQKGKAIKTTASQESWEAQFKSFLGSKNFKNYTYMRKNLLALSTWVREKPGEKAKKLTKLDLKLFSGFEKEILEIIGAMRLTIGLYEKVGAQYRTAGSDKKHLWYTAFLFTKDGVYSMADIFSLFLQENTSKGKDTIIKTEISEKSPKLTTDQLATLWAKKEKSIQKKITDESRKWVKKLNYKWIMSDSDVAAELMSIDKEIGKFNHYGSMKIQTTEVLLNKLLSPK